MASFIWKCATVHRRCHFSSTPSLGGGRAHVDSLDLRLSASVARQAQTTVSAIGGLRLAAPCSVAAASARGCGKRGVRDQPEVTLLYHLFVSHPCRLARRVHEDSLCEATSELTVRDSVVRSKI